jgi:hypothetical protein
MGGYFEVKSFGQLGMVLLTTPLQFRKQDTGPQGEEAKLEWLCFLQAHI